MSGVYLKGDDLCISGVSKNFMLFLLSQRLFKRELSNFCKMITSIELHTLTPILGSFYVCVLFFNIIFISVLKKNKNCCFY